MKIVYIIDDDITILKFLRIAFIELIGNFEKITETHGLRGFNLIKTGNPDLIILDIKLPGMTGLNICKELRSMKKFTSIPIIAFSGLDPDEYREKIINAGFNDFVSKTVDLSEFIKIVQKYLN